MATHLKHRLTGELRRIDTPVSTGDVYYVYINDQRTALGSRVVSAHEWSEWAKNTWIASEDEWNAARLKVSKEAVQFQGAYLNHRQTNEYRSVIGHYYDADGSHIIYYEYINFTENRFGRGSIAHIEWMKWAANADCITKEEWDKQVYRNGLKTKTLEQRVANHEDRINDLMERIIELEKRDQLVKGQSA